MERLRQKCKSQETITVTVDYSCLNKKGESEAMIKLRNMSQRGLTEMMGTEQMDKEFYETSPPAVRAKLRQQFEFFQKLYPEDPAIVGKARVGRFRVGGRGTVRDGKDTFDHFNDFKALMYPDFNSLSDENKKTTNNDLMHLSIHYVFGREIFLTKDKKFQTRARSLERRYPDLVAMTPQELVDFLEQHY